MGSLSYLICENGQSFYHMSTAALDWVKFYQLLEERCGRALVPNMNCAAVVDGFLQLPHKA